MEDTALELTVDQQTSIADKARQAAFAIAELWDAMREVEEEIGSEITYDAGALESLAGDVSIPPSFSDLSLEYTLQWLNLHRE